MNASTLSPIVARGERETDCTTEVHVTARYARTEPAHDVTSKELMVKPSQRSGEKYETQQRIVETALRLFEHHGYETTSMAQIARESHTSRANLYLHFTSKSQIVLHRMQALEPAVMELYDGLDVIDGTRANVLTWLYDAASLWEKYLAEFEAISRAMTADEAVFQEWFALHRRISAAKAPILAKHSNSSADQCEAHLTTLMISMEQNFYFIYVRGYRDREELVMQSLAIQWSTLFA